MLIVARSARALAKTRLLWRHVSPSGLGRARRALRPPANKSHVQPAISTGIAPAPKNVARASASSGCRLANSPGRGTLPAAEATGYSAANTSSTVAPSAPGQTKAGAASRYPASNSTIRLRARPEFGSSSPIAVLAFPEQRALIAVMPEGPNRGPRKNPFPELAPAGGIRAFPLRSLCHPTRPKRV